MGVYQLRWYESSPTLVLRFNGLLDVVEAQQMNAELVETLGKREDTVTLIIDAQGIDFTSDFATIRALLTYHQVSSIGHIYILATHKLTRLWMLLIHKHANVPVQFLKSQDELSDKFPSYTEELFEP